MGELVDRFCLTVERAHILEGFLELRSDLNAIGIDDGFQWVNGSFLENIEDTEARPPNDIDVVMFAFLPAGQTQQSFFPVLQPYLDRPAVKAKYKVDLMIRILPQVDIHDICYLYSLWSHRRDGIWKGYAEVSLDISGDPQAATLLGAKVSAGFQP